MPKVVITPPGRVSLPAIRHLWDAREVLIRFGMRDVTLRYRQTAVGVAWVILQPLLAAGVFTIVFGVVAGMPSGGTPYFVFSMAGMLAWTAFSGVVNRASGSLVANAALVSKVFFPRMLVPLSAVYSVVLDFLVGLALMAVLLAIYGIVPGWEVLLLPVWLVLLVLLASGIGLVASALMVRYRDVQYVTPFLVQLLMYASPVAYGVDAVPDSVRPFYDANPLTWLCSAFRWALLGDAPLAGWQIVASVVVSAGVFVIGVMIFEQMERGFADVI